MATNQEKFDRIHYELTNRFPSRARYRSSDNPVDTLVGFVLNIDAMSYEDRVESAAKRGTRWAIEAVQKTARGEGFDKSEGAVLDAQNLLKAIGGTW